MFADQYHRAFAVGVLNHGQKPARRGGVILRPHFASHLPVWGKASVTPPPPVKNVSFESFPVRSFQKSGEPHAFDGADGRRTAACDARSDAGRAATGGAYSGELPGGGAGVDHGFGGGGRGVFAHGGPAGAKAGLQGLSRLSAQVERAGRGDARFTLGQTGARRGHPARPSTRGAHELREVA